MRPSQAGLAIILRARAYRESDKIVTFLTRDFGKLTGIAKGAKNSRRRFANCLDPLTAVRVYFRSKPAATLVFMESCDLLRPATIFAEPVKFAYGSYLIELTDQLTGEAHPVPEVYDLLDGALTALSDGIAAAAFLRAFELHLLHHAGYEPHLESCAACHRSLAERDRVFLDPLQGSLVCGICRGPDQSWVPVAGETVAMLERLKGTTLPDAQTVRLPTVLAAEAAQLLGRLLSLHVARPLKSVGLITNLAQPRS
ncbi:MAG TPA: DNA repair protein RecO [Candidatus Binatia bacterium]|nr:DNA repair protein RecO [Candidatus Binatia bacterium]